MATTLRTTRRAALLGAAAAGALAAPAALRAHAPVRLTLGHGAAPGNPRSVAAERMAALLREKSSGRIEVRVAGSAQLGDDAAMLTALRTGTLDMSVNSQGASSAVLPELAALGPPSCSRTPPPPTRWWTARSARSWRSATKASG